MRRTKSYTSFSWMQDQGLSGTEVLAGLSGLPDSLLAGLPDSTLGRILQKEAGQKKQKQGKMSFDEVVKKYNQGISEDEIRAWVWYKRSLGIPMTAWKKYFLSDSKKADMEKLAYARHATQLLDNQWHKVGQVPANTLIGKPTRFEHEYDGVMYLVIVGTDGNKYIVNKKDVTIHESGQQVDEQVLEALTRKGCLFYANGSYLPYPVFAYGNMYERELQLQIDRDTIIAKFGEELYVKHQQIINRQKPRPLSVMTEDANERPKITVFSDFARSFMVTGLSDELGVNMGDYIKEGEEVSLKDAFRYYLASLGRDEFGVLSAVEIWNYYVEGKSMRGLSDDQKTTIMAYAPSEGDALFGRFLHEGLREEDQQKIDFQWNRLFNGFSNVPYSRIPVGFECSRTFMQSDKLEFAPAQREGIAFMQAAGSGIVAYDVGVGKTMTAIITLANAFAEGKTKRPLIVVPNPTYDKWKRELLGFTDARTKEFLPGVLSYCGYELNDWYNLGAKIAPRLNLDKPVKEGSITLMSYEGFVKIGYSRQLMDELFEELSDVLAQKEQESKSQRDFEKVQQKHRKMIGRGNKGTICDIDTLGFDFIIIDEAHNFKNAFVDSPTDEEGVKRYNISTGAEPTLRAVKAFFHCNYIQRKFGRNVMLLTATPFTNSPLEIYSMLSYVAYEKMKAMGVKNLQTFLETFIVQDLEYTNSYDNEIKIKHVVKRFNNRLVLQKMIHNHIAYKTGEDAGVRRPCKINLPRLYVKNADGQTLRLPAKDQVLTYLAMNEQQFANQQEIISLAQDKSRLSNIFKAMSDSLNNAISPFFYRFNEMPKDYKDFVDHSPKIKYTLECIRTVKEYHQAHDQPVSGQVIYLNRGKDFFLLIKEYLEKEIGYGKNLKFQGSKVDEVEMITGGMSADRKEKIKDAFQAGYVKIIIGTSTISEGIDLQKRGTVCYILLPDWNPTTIKQVEGRIHRQGNRHGYVRIVMPLVQDSMDVFIFQKLEEKSARINDIWYRADRGNVLDQESLDPEEVKFALYTNLDALTRIEQDKEVKDVNRRLSVAQSNFTLIANIKRSIEQFFRYQQQLTEQIQTAVKIITYDFANLARYEGERWYDQLTDKNKKALQDRIEEALKDAQGFLESTPREDKELLRVGRRLLQLMEDTQQRNLAYNLRTHISEFRKYNAEVKKAEKTTLAERGYTLESNMDDVASEIAREMEKINQELLQVKSQEYYLELYEQVKAKKERLQIKAASLMERVEDFETLNHLLDFTMADMERTQGCMIPRPLPAGPQPKRLPAATHDRPAAKGPSTNPPKAKRLRIAKAKAKALKIKLDLMEFAKVA